MTQLSHFPAKIAPPVLPEVLPRERLFRRLDEAREHPVIWISAPAGSGKTTLVASYLHERKLPALWYHIDGRDSDCASFFHYLSEAVGPRSAFLPRFTPENRIELPFFARTFFEALFSTALSGGGLFILEDYHHVTAESSLHRVIAEGVKALPKDVTLLVTGRSAPPSALARETLSRNLVLLDQRQLTFTPAEIGQTAGLYGKDLTSEKIGTIHQITGGWAAGILLMMFQDISPFSNAQMTEVAQEELFEFFAEEVFSRIDPGIQDFLIRMAWFPRFTVRAAEALSGLATAGDILARLHRECCFTEKQNAPEPVYQFNQLFRRYLQNRADRTYTAIEIERLQYRTANLLESMGEIEEAMSLYRQMEGWDQLILILERESERFLERGQSENLLSFLLQVPIERFSKHPRLHFYAGLSLLPSDPQESYFHFRRAFEIALEREDVSLRLRCWSGAVDALLLSRNVLEEIDFWINWIEKWKSEGASFPSEEVEARVFSSLAGALTFLAPEKPALRHAIRRALEVSEVNPDTSLRLHVLRNAAHYFLWMGRTAESVMTTEALQDLACKPSGMPSQLLTWKWLEVITAFWAEGDVEKGMVSQGALMAETKGGGPWENITLGLGVWGELLLGDLDGAGSFIDRMKETLQAGSRQGRSHFHYFASWYYVRRRHLPKARLHGEEALRLGSELGMKLPTLLARLALVQVHLAAGEKEEASRQLAIANAGILETESQILKYMVLLSEARIALDCGHVEVAKEHLRSAFALARKEGYSYLFAWWEPEVMVRFCSLALEAEIETEYVRNLIRHTKLDREPPPIHLDQWPYPIKIYTFGRLSILIDGQPIRFTGKVQQKPLELLKAVIALGGRNVATQQVCDLLWPDAEGDAAQTVFATTLHRLRKLMKNEGAILLANGRLSLDSSLCWVDTWAFQRLASAVEEVSLDMPLAEGISLMRKALSYYSGPFFASDSGAWALPTRDRLKGRYLHLVRRLGKYFEENGEIELAMECYRGGMGADPLSEEICRQFISCCRQLGRHGEGAAAAVLCQKALREAGFPTPSFD